MIEFHVRHRIQPLFNTGAYWCIARGLTPNAITGLALFLGISSACLLICKYHVLALSMLLLSGFCDVLDGTVARLTGTSHPFGAYLDLISDRMVEAALILAFAILYPHHYLVYILFLIAVLLHFSTFLAAGALFKNDGKKSMHYDRSFIERAEVFVIFSAMILFMQYNALLLASITCIIFLDATHRIVRVWRTI